MKHESLWLTLFTAAVIGVIWCFHINVVLGLITVGIYSLAHNQVFK